MKLKKIFYILALLIPIFFFNNCGQTSFVSGQDSYSTTPSNPTSPPSTPTPPDIPFIVQKVNGALLSLAGNFSGIFGQVPAGTVVKKLLSVKNLGTQTATNLLFSISNPAFRFSGGAFPGVSGTCSTTLAPQQSCALEIIFTAPASGVFSEKLSATFRDDSNPQTWSIGLYGATRNTGDLRKTFKAQLDYDVVYLRCPRGRVNAPISPVATTTQNIGGIKNPANCRARSSRPFT